MAEKPKDPNPEEKGTEGDEPEVPTPLTPEEGPGGGNQPPKKTPPTGTGLTPEEEEELKEFQEIKKTTGFKKFSESAREAQRLSKEDKLKDERNQELEAKLAESQRTLSEKELMNKYPNWEFMDENEKREAKEKFELEKRTKILEAKEKWRDDYARLPKETKEKIEKKGGEQAFKDFACSPENRGQKNLENLAKQFLYEEPKPEPEAPEEPEKKAGLEPGSGGPKTPITPKKGFTPEEAAELRKRNPQKYNKLAAEGRLKIIDKK